MEKGAAPYLDKTDFLRVIDAQDGQNAVRNRAALYLSYFLGLRAKELASLRVGDIYDSHRGQIRQTVRLLASMTKGGKVREVPIENAAAKQAVLEHIATRPTRHPEAPLLLSQKGGKFTANTMQKMIASCYRKAGITASSHSGRRSCATNLLIAGADLQTVKVWLGHSDISTTQRYLTTSPERLRKFAALL
jgi:integrase/recombinase XerD